MWLGVIGLIIIPLSRLNGSASGEQEVNNNTSAAAESWRSRLQFVSRVLCSTAIRCTLIRLCYHDILLRYLGYLEHW